MTIKPRILLMGCLLLAGCSGKYVGQPRASLLSFQTAPTYGSLHQLAVSYGESLNAALKADTLHPGMYADYGVTLAMMGHRGEACRMLNAEAKAFPESALLMGRLKQRLLPDMLADTFCSSHDTANLAQLMGWAYDSLAALVPYRGLPAVIDSTDTALIRLQTPVDSIEYPIRLTANQKRELLAQEQQRAAKLKQAQQDSIAAAKKAKEIDRKKAQADKKKARRKAEKEKKIAAKQRAKQREQEMKQRAAERQAQREAAKNKVAPSDSTANPKAQ